MKTFSTQYTVWVDVTVDESKFTEEFLAEFRAHFYELYTVRDHVQHLAQLYARGLVTEFTTFVEGYGEIDDFGIKFHVSDSEVDVLSEETVDD